jgi:DNA-binding NarL/FixJ family response regulator
MPSRVRVVLVDDAPLVRAGIARLLTDEGVEVVAELPDASGLAAAIQADPPDVVIIDVRMPPTRTTEGLKAAVQLKRDHPELGVLVLSQHVETRHAVELLGDGRRGVGYMLKERITRPAELVDAVHRVVAGGTAIDPEVVRVVFETPRRADPMARLTDRERTVLELVAEGHSNDLIAERLSVTPRTVESHTGRIFTKLGLNADPTTHRRVLAVLAHLRAGTSSAH